ncbi:member of Set1p complex, histone methyl transferase [Imshaugia aleurites]|uniref:Member of Set1p complex, histone methyl transferase n=1 Tax=Imshaugia aleurites TaxID=172621 RepID=A0A8H3ELY7_9LECA|nr:member of Set1p complex, histone methyl transferase [Imshaugia aleurites]
MAGPLVVPPPPPGGPQLTQKTSEVIGSFRPTKQFKLSKPEASVTSLDFDDSGEFCLAACSDDSLLLYNAKEGKNIKTLMSQKYGAHLARFTHHATSIIYASTKEDDCIRYLSTHDNAFLRYFRGHTQPVTSLCLCPGADTFLSTSLDNTVRLWSLSSPSPQARLNLSTPYLAAYDPSATVIAIASASTHSILLYDLRNYDKPPFATFDMRPYLTAPQVQSSKPDWTRLEFSNDGKSLLLASNHPQGHLLLDAFDGTLRAHCKRSHAPTNMRAAPGAPGALGQGDVCFSADGRYLIGGSGGERDAIVWDTQGQVEVETKEIKPMCGLPCKGRASVVEWNPRYNMCATADREVVFWLPDEHVGMKPP